MPQYASPRPLMRSLPVSSAAAATMTGPPNFWASRVAGVFGAEVAEVDDQGVDLLGPQLLERLEGVLFVLDDGRDAGDRQAGLPAFLGDAERALAGELDGEAIAADGDEAEADLGDVGHLPSSFFCP